MEVIQLLWICLSFFHWLWNLKAAMLLIPEPWLYNKANDKNVLFMNINYLMEPWDGPTMISFCNGDKIGALQIEMVYVQAANDY